MLCLGARSAGVGAFQRHVPNHSKRVGGSGEIREDPFKEGKKGRRNLRIFPNQDPSQEWQRDSSDWLLVASQGTVLRRILKLHSAQWERAV